MNIEKWVPHEAADFDEAVRQGARIVETCWVDIEKLAIYLQRRCRAKYRPL